jgi:hypothetical protein
VRERNGWSLGSPHSVPLALLVAAVTLWVAACSSKQANGAAGNGTGTDAAGGRNDASTDAGNADVALDASFLYVDAPPPSIAPTALPAQGTYLGAFVDIMNAEGGAATDEASEQRFVAAEELIDRKWVIDNRFYDDSTEFVSVRTEWDKANQIVPMITWMPYGNGNPLVEIIQGVHDAAIQAEAQKAKALGVQIFMRWGHEMNGNWYPWAGYVNGEGGDSDGGLDDAGLPSTGAGKYVAAWRHVHDIFVQEGATNVFWVWCPNANDVPEVPWNHWTNYYPGDEYVDWVGIDAYNWGTSSSCCIWQSFATILTPSPYQDYAGKKPLILPETASAEVGGNKAEWIDDMHQGLKTEFTGIRAVVWFDINKETDWRINSSPSALAAYESMAHDPLFNP